MNMVLLICFIKEIKLGLVECGDFPYNSSIYSNRLDRCSTTHYQTDLVCPSNFGSSHFANCHLY